MAAISPSIEYAAADGAAAALAEVDFRTVVVVGESVELGVVVEDVG
jgi:hypothetical protein